MFNTLAEYDVQLTKLRSEKESYLKAADDVDNNIKLLEAERAHLERNLKAEADFAREAKIGAHQIKMLVDSFVNEGFDEATAKQMTVSILAACMGREPASIDSLVGIIGGF